MLKTLNNYNSETLSTTSTAAAPSVGLFNAETKEIIPLRFMDVVVNIQENIAKVSLEHHYTNISDKIIDTSFNFPKSPDAVFHSMTIKLGDKEIEAIVDEKKKIQTKYAEAVEKGDTVVMTEVGNTFLSQGVVTTKIGNFLPKEEMILTYTYVEKLSVSMNKYYKFILPSTLTPRYVPGKDFVNLVRELLVDDIESIKQKTEDYVKNSKIVYLKDEDKYSYTWNIKTVINSSSMVTIVLLMPPSIVISSSGYLSFLLIFS